jgi:ferredoxin
VTKQFELVVDRIKCDGRGLCAEILPERIRLDSWGYPIIAPGPIPEHLIGLAQRAVDDCPVLAIALRRAEVQSARRAQGVQKQKGR